MGAQMTYVRPFPWRMLLCFQIGMFLSLYAFSQGQTLNSFGCTPVIRVADNLMFMSCMT
jgi:hypothetical protein